MVPGVSRVVHSKRPTSCAEPFTRVVVARPGAPFVDAGLAVVVDLAHDRDLSRRQPVGHHEPPDHLGAGENVPDIQCPDRLREHRRRRRSVRGPSTPLLGRHHHDDTTRQRDWGRRQRHDERHGVSALTPITLCKKAVKGAPRAKKASTMAERHSARSSFVLVLGAEGRLPETASDRLPVNELQRARTCQP